VIVGGVDPGLAHCGIARVDVTGQTPRLLSWEVIETPAQMCIERRWLRIYRALDEALVNVNAVGIEEQRGAWLGAAREGGTNADALRNLECVGLARGWALARRLPVIAVEPVQAKIALLGPHSMQAKKKQIRARVRELSGQDLPEHAADAVAIAIAAAPKLIFERALAAVGR
jgi:Holliday junction resolvasome RuvABC endonuclease subunit